MHVQTAEQFADLRAKEQLPIGKVGWLIVKKIVYEIDNVTTFLRVK